MVLKSTRGEGFDPVSMPPSYINPMLVRTFPPIHVDPIYTSPPVYYPKPDVIRNPCPVCPVCATISPALLPVITSPPPPFTASPTKPPYTLSAQPTYRPLPISPVPPPRKPGEPIELHQLLGMDKDKAYAYAKQNYPTLSIQMIQAGSMMTKDYNLQRLRIIYDGATNRVSEIPKTG